MAKLKAEPAEAKERAEAEKGALIVEVAIEYMRCLLGGRKQTKLAAEAQEKLSKACRCHWTFDGPAQGQLPVPP